MPVEFFAPLMAANMLGERQRAGLEKYELNFPVWAIEAYKANERTFAKAEGEHNAKIGQGEEDDSLSISKKAKDEDSDAFADILDQFNELAAITK